MRIINVKKKLIGLSIFSLFLILFSLSVSADLCYQETANVSTACGGLSTGSYSLTSGWSDPANLYDGDWSTYARSPSEYNYAYINYTIPVNSIDAIWQVAEDNMGYQVDNFTLSDYNCDMSGSILQLEIRSLYSTGFGEGRGDIYCYNGTGWKTIRTLNGGAAGNEIFYEEAVYWNITQTTNSCTYSGSGNFTISASDNCSVETNYDLSGNDLIIEGYGNITINANLTNVGDVSIKGINSTQKCNVLLTGGHVIE